MTTRKTRDYDLHDHLARGRQMRSAAFLSFFAWAVRGVKGAIRSNPKGCASEV